MRALWREIGFVPGVDLIVEELLRRRVDIRVNTDGYGLIGMVKLIGSTVGSGLPGIQSTCRSTYFQPRHQLHTSERAYQWRALCFEAEQNLQSVAILSCRGERAGAC